MVGSHPDIKQDLRRSCYPVLFRLAHGMLKVFLLMLLVTESFVLPNEIDYADSLVNHLQPSPPLNQILLL